MNPAPGVVQTRDGMKPAQGGHWEQFGSSHMLYVFHSDRVSLAGGMIVKRDGVIVERVVKVNGVSFDYPWGVRQDRDSLSVIQCGGCNRIIAQDVDDENSNELAELFGAHYSGGDEGPDEWFCAACIEENFRDGMAMAAEYDREMQINAIRDETRDATDALLDRADEMKKRTRGE